MSNKLKTILMGLTGATMLATAAHAGGYSRGAADLNPLLTSERFELSSSLAIVSPSRGYQTINGIDAGLFPAAVPGGAAGAGGDYASTYFVFGATGAARLTENLKCAGSFAQPFGANADYGFNQINSGTGTTTSTELSSVELGFTCAGSAEVGKGRLHVIGGLFYQEVSYNEERGFGFGSPLGGGDIALRDGGVGYRFGLAYTIPEIALNASLMYRSGVNHVAEGLTRNPAFPVPGNAVESFANVTTPQSVKLSVQTGVAPGWLVFGSVEWTDWSVIQQVQVFAKPGQLAAVAVPLAGVTIDGFFRDGWTVQGGVGHAFNDKLAGQVSLTWDRGVSAVVGADEVSGFTDTWTIGVGGRYSISEKASVSAGLAYSILTAGDYTTLDGDTIALGTDSAIAGGVSFNVKF